MLFCLSLVSRALARPLVSPHHDLGSKDLDVQKLASTEPRAAQSLHQTQACLRVGVKNPDSRLPGL
jgi:hypothetical protein